MVVHAEYELDKRLGCHREINIPPKELYEPLGWDPEPIPE